MEIQDFHRVSLKSEQAIFMRLKRFVRVIGEKKQTPHMFSIAGVDFSPSIQQFSCFTVCFCQVWLELLRLQPNLNEHLVLFHFKNSAQIMRQQARLA